jgi:hypothetical protein
MSKRNILHKKILPDRYVIFLLIGLLSIFLTLIFVYVNIQMEEVLYISTTNKIISF